MMKRGGRWDLTWLMMLMHALRSNSGAGAYVGGITYTHDYVGPRPSLLIPFSHIFPHIIGLSPSAWLLQVSLQVH